jgi:phage replication O-like protein O
VANPQTENGYTRIANELLEALASHSLTGNDLKIVLAIMRKTYGFQKKRDTISFNQLSVMTGILRRNVIRTVNGLVERKILDSVKGDTRKPSSIGINKNYSVWQDSVASDTSVIDDTKVVSPVTPDLVSLATPTKEKKETKQKKRTTSCSSIDERAVADDKFFTEFWAAYPRKTGKGAARKAWKKIKSPKATLEKILTALDWQKKSEQWTKNGGQYIPHPGTYLNQERWEDEPEGESSTEAKHITCPHCSQYMAIFEIKNNKCPACGGRIDL